MQSDRPADRFAYPAAFGEPATVLETLKRLQDYSMGCGLHLLADADLGGCVMHSGPRQTCACVLVALLSLGLFSFFLSYFPHLFVLLWAAKHSKDHKS